METARSQLVIKRAAAIIALAAVSGACVALCAAFGPDALAFLADAPRFRSWIDDAGIAGCAAFVAANAAQVVIALLPGMRKHTKSSRLKRWASAIQRTDRIFSTEKNSSTTRVPKDRTSARTIVVPKALATRQSAVPSQKPNA